MVCREQDNSEGVCGFVSCVLVPAVVPSRRRKKNYSDILKVCDPRCIRKMDRFYLG